MSDVSLSAIECAIAAERRCLRSHAERGLQQLVEFFHECLEAIERRRDRGGRRRVDADVFKQVKRVFRAAPFRNDR